MKEFVCIVCPGSCRLRVEDGPEGIVVSGNTCKRGLEYGVNEYTDPKRMLTTTVLCEGGALPRLPVISGGELQKARLPECLQELYGLRVQAPVTMGDTILRDICGTGIDILASRSIGRAISE